MKHTITLDGSEIRLACADYLKHRLPEAQIDWHDLKIAQKDGDSFVPVFDSMIQYIAALKEDDA